MRRGVLGMLVALVCATPACGGDKNTEPSGTGGGNVTTGGAGNGTGGATTAGGSGGQSGGGAAGAGQASDGALGSGSVACTPVAGGMCSAGTACCDHPLSSQAGCVSSFSACSCYANGACPILGCDGPEDCPGQHCCASIDVSQSLLKTWCRATCLADELAVCHVPGDCSGSNPLCKSYAGYVDVCF